MLKSCREKTKNLSIKIEEEIKMHEENSLNRLFFSVVKQIVQFMHNFCKKKKKLR